MIVNVYNKLQNIIAHFPIAVDIISGSDRSARGL
jgi:hypothetical protein